MKKDKKLYLVVKVDLKEEWKEIYNGYYKISNKGRLKRNKPGPGTYVGRILKPRYRTKDNMYPSYILSIYGEHITREVHKLVSEAFIGPCPKGYDVNHIDGDKENPHANNLEYITRSENKKHAIKIGMENKNLKLNKKKVIKIRKLYKTGNYTYRRLAKKFNVNYTCIGHIIKKRTWSYV